MKTAAEYRAMAEECFEWARKVRTSEVRASYLQLARVWLDIASKLDGLPPTRLLTPANLALGPADQPRDIGAVHQPEQCGQKEK